MSELADQHLRQALVSISPLGKIRSNHSETIEHLRQAAKSGSAEAASLLGFYFHFQWPDHSQRPPSTSLVEMGSTSGETDPLDEARQWLISAASNGCDDALQLLFTDYQNDLQEHWEVPLTDVLSQRYQQLEQATGSADGLRVLGQWRLLGIGCQADRELAQDYFEKASVHGSVKAMVYLAFELLESVAPQAARFGRPDQLFAHPVEIKHQEFSEQQTVAALDNSAYWAERIISAGEETGHDLLSIIEWLRAESLAAPLNIVLRERAIQHAKLAAEKGSDRGCLFLGQTMLEGDSPNRPEAQKILEYGSQAGSSGCLYALGKLHLNGAGGQPDHNQAMLFLEKAAQLGNRRAANELAGLIEESMNTTTGRRSTSSASNDSALENGPLAFEDLDIASDEDDAFSQLLEYAEAGSVENVQHWLQSNSKLFRHPAWNEYRWSVPKPQNDHDEIGMLFAAHGAFSHQELSLAIQTRNLKFFELLMEQGININLCPDGERSPLGLIRENRHGSTPADLEILNSMEKRLIETGAFHDSRSLGNACPYGTPLVDLPVVNSDLGFEDDELERIAEGTVWPINVETFFSTHPVSLESQWHFSPDYLTWERSSESLNSFRDPWPEIFSVIELSESKLAFCEYDHIVPSGPSETHQARFGCRTDFPHLMQWCLDRIEDFYPGCFFSDELESWQQQSYVSLAGQFGEDEILIRGWDPGDGEECCIELSVIHGLDLE